MLAQRFDVADDRRKRCAQFVAGIGDEVRVRAAHIRFGRLGNQFDDRRPVIDRKAADPPHILAAYQAGNDRFAVTVRIHHRNGARMANRNAHILSDHMTSEKRTGRGVRDHHPFAVHQQQRRMRVLDHPDQVFARNAFLSLIGDHQRLLRLADQQGQRPDDPYGDGVRYHHTRRDQQHGGHCGDHQAGPGQGMRLVHGGRPRGIRRVPPVRSGEHAQLRHTTRSDLSIGEFGALANMSPAAPGFRMVTPTGIEPVFQP